MTIWQVLGIAGFLILCGIWLILYAALVNCAKWDDREGTR